MISITRKSNNFSDSIKKLFKKADIGAEKYQAVHSQEVRKGFYLTGNIDGVESVQKRRRDRKEEKEVPEGM